ncbi:REP-associated tyrosine transposase [Microbulbifer yueqingensis]|uniref:REP element-mobilizing transposase RayT n=1 Tax=Microbulbifer yueqingensis TaxID=658219 RepID=A0A1G8XKA0_9GAMM|nr:REP element-mobilizing transposase RayT [Microbulbifer yueqingensis]
MNQRPHGHRLRLGRHSEPNRIYLITAVCYRRRRVFADFWRGRAFVASLREVENSACTLCYVVMPDHIHWLMQLAEESNLSQTVQKVKALTTMLLRDRWHGQVWQRGFHDHALRSEEDVREVARYLVANPLRAGLVSSARYYPLWDAEWL